jgi:hypothetical protein
MPFLAPAIPWIVGGLGAAGAASSAAGSNRQSADQTQLSRDQLGERAYADFQQQLLQRAAMEAEQRRSANRDLYRAQYFNRPAPTMPAGVPDNLRHGTTSAVSAAQNALTQQALQRLLNTPQYGTDTMEALRQYQIAPPSKPGFWEKFGNIAGGVGAGLGVAHQLGAFKPKPKPDEYYNDVLGSTS